MEPPLEVVHTGNWGQAPSLREHPDRIVMKRAELYRYRPPEGLRVPIMVMPTAVDDGVLEEAEIEQSVRCLKGVKSGIPYRMWA